MSNPAASNRARISSLKVKSVDPSNEIPLESYKTIRLSNFKVPAKDIASEATPSIKSPSPTKVYI